MIPSILFHLGDSQHKESGERLLMLIEQRPFCFLHSNMYIKKNIYYKECDRKIILFLKIFL